MQKIKKYIIEGFKSRFVKDLSVVFSENIITKFLNFIIIILLTRFLGPSDYGKYSFIFIAMATISAITDFGMENTVVRFSSRDKDVRNNIFGLYFIVKMIILISVILAIFFWGETTFIAINKQEIIEYIPYLSIAITGESLFFINDTYLQSVQKFKLRALINISRYMTCLSYITILLLNKMIMLKYVFYIYFIPLCISLIFLPKYIEFLKVFFQQKIKKILLLEIWDYEKWILNAAIGANILNKLDFFMLSFWVNYSQIGIYNAAIQLTSIVSFLPYSLGKVMLPKMSELKGEEIFVKAKQIIKPIIILALCTLCLIPLANWIVPLCFGSQYTESIAVLQILLVAFILLFMTMPLEQAFFALGKPQFITVVKYLQILILIVLNILFIPKYGVIAAAFNVLIIRIFSFIVNIFLFIEEEKKIKICLNKSCEEVCYE